MVQGVREMCDVCDTTLFSFHWACGRCGFVVCVDCYHDRKSEKVRSWPNGGGDDSDDKDLSDKEQQQQDGYSWQLCTNKSSHDLEKLMLTQIITGDLLEKLNSKLKKVYPAAEASGNDTVGQKDGRGSNSLRELMGDVKDFIEDRVQDEQQHYIRKWGEIKEDRVFFRPNDLDNHRVLRMDNGEDTEAFRQAWGQGQPVLVTEMTRKMNVKLWSPSALVNEFGDQKVEFVDAVSGDSLGHHSLQTFFQGFSVASRRSVRDKEGRKAVVKLKDWPAAAASEDFFSTPRAEDFLQHLPFQSYTSKRGVFNLTSALPDVFMRPDLGPRVFLSYGNGVDDAQDRPTFDHVVNLHTELVDAVHAVVHAEVPSDLDRDQFRQEVLRVMDTAGCDPACKRRVREAKELPGMIWQVIRPSDADKVRDLLNRKRNRVELNFDPIHEEATFLDESTWATLKSDYNVEPFVVAQFPGEALVLPAGCLRQVGKGSQSYFITCVDFGTGFLGQTSVFKVLKFRSKL